MADGRAGTSSHAAPSRGVADAPGAARRSVVSSPKVTLPKGGGAIRGIGEKVAANPVTGTASFNVPVTTSPGRAGFGPSLSLTYDSGAGNGIFGLGWSIALPSIARKTEKGRPRYDDASESDTFMLAGSEDLVPALRRRGDGWEFHDDPRTLADGSKWRVRRYRPRVEEAFVRIERWTAEDGAAHWRSISPSNVTTLYGLSDDSRIADPADPTRVFTWLISASHDDCGNAVFYDYVAEDDTGVDRALASERNRVRGANRHPKAIRYGNRAPHVRGEDLAERDDWMFEVVFDYGDHDETTPTPGDGGDWTCRNDPFSSCDAGFEVRTYRLCRRVLMFHHFPAADGVGADCLVQSTDLTYRDDPERGSAVASVLAAVANTGYRRAGAGYVKRSLPPVELEYSQPAFDPTIRTVAGESVENLPQGADGARFRWLDLDGEGLTGILAEHGDGWFYKRNLSALPYDGGEEAEGGEPPAGDAEPGPGGQRAGPARFAPLERVDSIPATADLAAGRQQLLDLAGDGTVDLVQFAPPLSGYHERELGAGWSRFVPFEALPNLSWGDPNLRFVDLSGDGHADVAISDDGELTWYPSLGQTGFDAPERVAQALDEESGPRMVFADGTESLHLADMSGDGHTDLVRIRNGEVAYWPNLGYGRFGAKVTMDASPWFDTAEQFSQNRIRLADIDGSGVTDLLYLHDARIVLHANLSGNAWAPPRPLPRLGGAEGATSVEVVDLLGNGTQCIVASSPLGDTARPLRYLDPMGGLKPHLLTKVRNNMGAETTVRYAPSTRFYLEDRARGKPWLTRLPFPVQVVEQVQIDDRVAGNRFITRYAYHHGHFDGEEREFRGFGFVEQWDTDELAALSGGDAEPPSNVDGVSHVPPTYTCTWFHTGARPDPGTVAGQFEQEYWREPGLTDEQARSLLLDDTVLPTDVLLAGGNRLEHVLTPEEEHEALRALRGSTLRQEVYALDGGDAQERPYSVSETNHTIELLQPRAVDTRHAVFARHPRESLAYEYERRLYQVGQEELADPRVSHQLTLLVNPFGNVEQVAAVGYGRRREDASGLLEDADHARQAAIVATVTEQLYTSPVDEDDAYRLPLGVETTTYQLLDVKPEPAVTGAARITPRFRFDELRNQIAAASDGDHDVDYEDLAAVEVQTAEPRRRLIERVRTLYRTDALTQVHPLGQAGTQGQVFEEYRLAFTPGLLDNIYGDLIAGRDAVLGHECGYASGDELKAAGRFPASDPAGLWWMRGGRVFYARDDADNAAERAHAEAHFFLQHRYEDPFGNATRVTYDDDDLLVLDVEDPVGNRLTAGDRSTAGAITSNGNDYRVLQPRLVTDANRNRAGAAFDARGMVVGTAAMGKRGPNSPGDSFDDFTLDLSEAAIAAHLADPLADPNALLGTASSRLVYDVFAYSRTRDDEQPQPAAVATLARVTHESDLGASEQSALQHQLSYSDGFGQEIAKKAQAEPGPLVDGGPDVGPRWVGSGWSVFDNKGNPVRTYEPFFSATHLYEPAREVGVSAVAFYDPVGRNVATLHPNHTFEKVVFDPWGQTRYDVNDTVLVDDPAADPDVGGYFDRLDTDEYLPTWHQRREGGALGAVQESAADKAAAHADTPTITFFDTLSRPFLTLEHDRFVWEGATVERRCGARPEADIEGNQRSVRDSRGRVAVRYEYDMLGNRVRQASMEGGTRRMLNDVTGKPVYTWNSRGETVRTVYDDARRPIEVWLDPAGATPPRQVVRNVYGESAPDAERDNMRGRMFQASDGAGVVTLGPHDFKGNPERSVRRLAAEYKQVLDWSAPVALEPGPGYVTNTTFDALNRPVTIGAPDGSVMRPQYNEANALERLAGNVRGAAQETEFVSDVDYDSKGRRSAVEYGNGAITRWDFDPETFRVVTMTTTRGDKLQDLAYAYDPIGNLTRVTDAAQQTLFFRNRKVEPSADYTYGATYRLVEATGREHLGQLAGGDAAPPTPATHTDAPRFGLLHRGDGKAMGAYVERYLYDEVGNFEEVRHVGTDPANPGWRRAYAYTEASALEPGKKTNRLSTTRIGTGPVDSYEHDEHGCMTATPDLHVMRWNHLDQLVATSTQDVAAGTPQTTYYVYDAGGRRVRKVTERHAGPGAQPTRMKERIYVDGLEIYREYDGSGDTVTLERETLDVRAGNERIAMVETRTVGNDGTPSQLVRFQFGNYLDSALLELDDQGGVITYEEYYPYGGTSYEAVRGQTDTPKRYRHAGKERDEESGLYYYGARYSAPWLGRWISPDPEGVSGGVNLYAFAASNPIGLRDPDGRQVANNIDDVLQFLWAQSGFEAGATRPLSWTRNLARPFGTAAHNLSPQVLQGMQDAKILGAEQIYTGVRVSTQTGTVLGINVNPGGALTHNLDVVVMQQGRSLQQGQQFLGAGIDRIGDLKYGGGTIAPKYGQWQSPLQTINGVTQPSAAVNTGSGAAAAVQQTAAATQQSGAATAATVNAAEQTAATGAKVEQVAAAAAKGEQGAQAVSAAAKAEQGIQAVGTAAKVEQTAAVVANGSRITSLLGKAAPIAAKLATPLKVVGKVAGPLGIGIGVVQIATAKNTEQKIDGGITAVSSALMMSKHPVAIAAGAGLMAGQAIEKTLDVSEYSSAAGVASYEKLKSAGVNEDVAFVAGAVVTVASTPVAIGVAAVDKGWKAAKSVGGWLSKPIPLPW